MNFKKRLVIFLSVFFLCFHLFSYQPRYEPRAEAVITSSVVYVLATVILTACGVVISSTSLRDALCSVPEFHDYILSHVYVLQNNYCVDITTELIAIITDFLADSPTQSEVVFKDDSVLIDGLPILSGANYRGVTVKFPSSTGFVNNSYITVTADIPKSCGFDYLYLSDGLHVYEMKGTYFKNYSDAPQISAGTHTLQAYICRESGTYAWGYLYVDGAEYSRYAITESSSTTDKSIVFVPHTSENSNVFGFSVSSASINTSANVIEYNNTYKENYDGTKINDYAPTTGIPTVSIPTKTADGTATNDIPIPDVTQTVSTPTEVKDVLYPDLTIDITEKEIDPSPGPNPGKPDNEDKYEPGVIITPDDKEYKDPDTQVNIFNKIVTFFDSFFTNLLNLFKPLLEPIFNLSSRILTYLKSVLSPMYDVLVSFKDFVQEKLGTIISYLSQIAVSVSREIKINFPSISFLEPIPDILTTIKTDLESWILDLPGKIQEFPKKLYDWAVEIGSYIIAMPDAIGDYISALPDAIGTKISGLWENLSTAYESIKDKIGTIGDSVGAKVDAVKDGLKEATDAIKDGLKDLFTPTIDIGELIIQPDEDNPMDSFDFSPIFELEPKEFVWEGDITIGNKTHHIVIAPFRVDVVANNLDTMRKVLTYTMLFLLILHFIRRFEPVRVMD